MPRLKVVRFGFRVPVSLDTPSETMAKMAALLVQGLQPENLTSEEQALRQALLTES